MSLNGKAAIVTGSGSGIGRACALRLARDGAAVAVWDIDEAAAAETVRLIENGGGRSIAYFGDAAEKASIDSTLARIRGDLGRVLVLVNNAGVFSSKPFLEIDREALDNIYRVNLIGPFMLTQAVIPDMLAVNWGRIINISSAAGQAGGKGVAHYASSKGGIISLTKALAVEFSDRGITVNNIPPAVIDTPMTRRVVGGNLEAIAAAAPMKRIGQPEDIAAACSYLASEAASYVSGQTLGVNGARVVY